MGSQDILEKDCFTMTRLRSRMSMGLAEEWKMFADYIKKKEDENKRTPLPPRSMKTSEPSPRSMKTSEPSPRSTKTSEPSPRSMKTSEPSPRSIVDSDLELLDPTPSIHCLFQRFNKRFFECKLWSVQLKWNTQMKISAGICTFYPRTRQCTIRLSEPLLKLRPRKDLVETLLHEMIHAYLFLAANGGSRQAHGPDFCYYMDKINKEAGTNITIYHDFHNEVALYRQHWWKCNGPCQHRAPYFGTVRRCLNRVPGPNDYWWMRHQQSCNGQFIKIKEPKNFKPHPKQNNISKSKSKDNKQPTLDVLMDPPLELNWPKWFAVTGLMTPIVLSDLLKSKAHSNNSSKIFTQADNAKSSTSNDNGGTNSSRAVNEKDLSVGVKKLGSSSNNVHSFNGLDKNVKSDNVKNTSKNPKFSCAGVLGGSNSGQSNLLSKFEHMNSNESRVDEAINRSSSLESSSATERSCADRVDESINKGSSSESSSATTEQSASNSVLNLSRRNNISRTNTSIPCPICNIVISGKIYDHVDDCIMNNADLLDEMNNNINNNNNNEELIMLPVRTLPTSVAEQNVNANTTANKRVRLDNSNGTIDYVTCPVCSKRLPTTDINQHLDECLLEAETTRKAAIPSTSRASHDDSIISINSPCSSDLNDTDMPIEDPQPSTSTSTSASISTCSTKNDAADLERKCLVCNEQIAPEVSLNEHLEDCIGGFFNTNMQVFIEDEDTFQENNFTETKHNCPVCMGVISENLMNEHLDECLKNE